MAYASALAPYPDMPTPALTPSTEQNANPKLERDEDDQVPVVRTLFIRNIPYKTPADEIELLCRSFGPLQRYFGMIDNRGLAFVSYVPYL